MPLLAKSDATDFERQIPDADIHDAVVVDVVDMGIQQQTFGGETKERHKIMLTWELGQEHPDFDGPFRVNKTYTLSLHEKANLAQDLEGWRGKRFTDLERQEGFDIFSVYHKPCRLMIEHNEKNDRTYANVTKVMPAKKGEELEPSGYYTPGDWIEESGYSSVHAQKNYRAEAAKETAEDEQADYVQDDDLPF